MDQEKSWENIPAGLAVLLPLATAPANLACNRLGFGAITGGPAFGCPLTPSTPAAPLTPPTSEALTGGGDAEMSRSLNVETVVKLE